MEGMCASLPSDLVCGVVRLLSARFFSSLHMLFPFPGRQLLSGFTASSLGQVIGVGLDNAPVSALNSDDLGTHRPESFLWHSFCAWW